MAAYGQELHVQGDDALYRYDARSLRLIAREESALASASSIRLIR